MTIEMHARTTTLPAAALLALSLLLSFTGPASAAQGDHDHAADARMQKWQKNLARPSLAVSATFDPQGRLWIASMRDGYLAVSVSDDQGKSFGPPVRITPEGEHVAGDGENRPKIVAAGNGRVYVSYTQSLDRPMTGHIRFSRSLDGGKTFSAPVTVNDDHQVISHRFETLGVNARGEIHLAWLDKRDLSAARRKGEPYTGAAVYRAISRDGGETFTNSKVLDHSCECCRVAMALDRDGVPVIAWRHVYEGNIRDHALARLDGTSTPVRASNDQWRVNACPHHGPALAINDQGAYHLAWFSNAPQRRGLFYANSTDQGRSFSTPMSFGGEGSAHPSVLAVGARVFLVWKEFDGKQMTIRLLRSTDGGASWSTPTVAAETAGASDHPFLIAHDGAAYLSWNTANEGYRLLPLQPAPAP